MESKAVPHLMADGRPCELEDGHKSCHRPVGRRRRNRNYMRLHRMTAAGMLAEVRHIATRRGN